MSLKDKKCLKKMICLDDIIFFGLRKFFMIIQDQRIKKELQKKQLHAVGKVLTYFLVADYFVFAAAISVLKRR